MTEIEESLPLSPPENGTPQGVNDLPVFADIADAAHQRVLARARELRPVLAEKRRLRQEEEDQRQARAASGDWSDLEDITFG